MFNDLTDRVLWHDGSITIDPQNLYKFADVTGITHVTEVTKDVRQYNALVSKDKQLTVKEDLTPWEMKWNIPPEYASTDILQYCIDCLEREDGLSEAQYDERLTRIIMELKAYKKHKLFNLLRTLIYVINTFNRDGVVWGFGRGSSVSSYVLYLIGVHDVDSVEYDLDFTDFIKT